MNDITGKYLFLPAFAHSSIAAPGHDLVTARDLKMILGIGGGARGYNTEGDVLTMTADGRDLNDLWREFTTTVALQNEQRQTLIDFLTFPVVNVIEDVPQISGDDFEEASEFGVPKSIRPGLTYFSMAYTFKWYDLAARFTWKYLAEALASQVEAVHSSVLEADNRLVFREVMKTLFNSDNLAATIRQQNYTVYKLYNGDGTIPPAYKSNTFDGNHTHYVTSGAATVDSGDLEDMFNHLREHGYSETNGVKLVMLCNKKQVDVIRTFRVNVENNNGKKALYDFIPAAGAPPFLIPGTGLIGNQPQPALSGLTVVGQYGPALIVEEEYIPADYMVLIGTGGKANLNNPIGIREHANPALRGLRLVKGANPDYPLIDSYYSRGFGTGVRQRGGAVVMEVTADATYTIPAAYV